eukprot:3810520-Lingulodinium_polyedra.AAC.1
MLAISPSAKLHLNIGLLHSNEMPHAMRVRCSSFSAKARSADVRSLRAPGNAPPGALATRIPGNP